MAVDGMTRATRVYYGRSGDGRGRVPWTARDLELRRLLDCACSRRVCRNHSTPFHHITTRVTGSHQHKHSADHQEPEAPKAFIAYYLFLAVAVVSELSTHIQPERARGALSLALPARAFAAAGGAHHAGRDAEGSGAAGGGRGCVNVLDMSCYVCQAPCLHKRCQVALPTPDVQRRGLPHLQAVREEDAAQPWEVPDRGPNQ